MLKPSPEIYRFMLNKLQLPANECVFIDDRRRNLAPAAELGIETILFDRNGSGYDGKSVASFSELREMLETTGL